MSKYDPLRDFLNSLPRGQKQVTLGFKRLEELLGEPLPASALEYEQWWRGGRVKRGRIDANWQDQVQQRAWEDNGWTIEELQSRPFMDFVHPDDRERVSALGDEKFTQLLATHRAPDPSALFTSMVAN